MESALNTFQGGLELDVHPLSSTELNKALTYALNATLLTFNGNENSLLNDMGNARIKDNNNEFVSLKSGYVPLAVKEFGGVLYIISTNQSNIEIGSFPSPDYTLEKEKSHTMLNKYQPLKVLLDENGDDIDLNVEIGNDTLKYNLQDSISIDVLQTFDGSLDLIINDGLEWPRLFNTGFAVLDNNNCKIIKRYEDNNTNRYTLSLFKLLTSLYRNTSLLSYFEYIGLQENGQLQVGNYVLYAILCDKDGNESDIICESGMIPVFFGTDGDAFSVHGGIQKQRTDKAINVILHNLDAAYPFVKICYSIATADNEEQALTLYYKIDKMYPVSGTDCKISITGYEDVESITNRDINEQYFLANTAKAQAICLNMLFLGNISQDNNATSLEQEYLKQISLQIEPSIVNDEKVNMPFTYKPNQDLNKSYYNSKFTYYYTGYHSEEIYRFGIVYIRNDNSKTNVFNVLGVNNMSKIEDNNQLHSFKSVNLETNKYWITNNIDENNNIICDETYDNTYKYNTMGVCYIDPNVLTDMTLVLGIKFNIPESIKELKAKGYKGFFFVRLKRIPTKLASGYATNICEEAYVPSINVNIGTEQAPNCGYLYESFVQGGFATFDSTKITNNFYPKKVVSSNNGFSLRDTYNKRLFTLTNNNRAYFDKYVGPIDPVIYYWKEVANLKFDSTLWWSSTGGEVILGGYSLEEDDYLIVIATNATGERHDDAGEDCYLLQIAFLLKTKDNTNSITFASANLEPGKIGNSKWNSYFYNNITLCLQYYTDSYSSNLNIQDVENYSIPKYYKYDNITYEYKHHIRTRSSILRHVNEFFQSKFTSYIQSHNNANYIETGNLVNETGYNLNISSFDGKFLYQKKSEQDDYSSVPLNPVQFNSFAIFCPEYELNLPYYNNIFTGQKVVVKPITSQKYLSTSNDNQQILDRQYVYDLTQIQDGEECVKTFALSVPENVSLLTINHNSNLGKKNYIYNKGRCRFSTKVGNEFSPTFKFAGAEFLAYNPPPGNIITESVDSNNNNKHYIAADTKFKVNTNKPFNIVRGIYSAYVGVCPEREYDLSNKLVNIYIPNYDPSLIYTNYFQLRFDDISEYQSISDNVSIDFENNPICYRGDCFFNWYTHRVNRNFNDNAAPYNDIILNHSGFNTAFNGCFSEDYRTFDLSKDEKAALALNMGDLNAVKLGSWITFPVRTSNNTCLRCTDGSWTTESFECGHDRTFYPLLMDASGSNKIPESYSTNAGYSKSGGDRKYFTNTSYVYNKQYFKNRIIYSNIKVSGLFKNNHRTFLSTHYKDYSDLFGEIVKIISYYNNLLVVMEHGIMLLAVNERALAAEGAGGQVFINNSNVLPANPEIISPKYGSLWPDSIIETPYGIFGVDAVSKKIWSVVGKLIKIISDYKIQSFLNTALSMYNKTRSLNLVNIKTHYNSFKNDVLFTAYNHDVASEEDLVLWNLCYNINLGSAGNGWMTFYSWIPSMSENIGNNFISFNELQCHNILLHNDTKPIYLWKHGQSDFISNTELIMPTTWYGTTHPFEFEFVVNKNPVNHKIFNTLLIISNNVAPESFHYEVVGDSYKLGQGESGRIYDNRATMYLSQELLKLYYSKLTNGKIRYDKDFLQFKGEIFNNKQVPVMTYFPLYYNRYLERDIIRDYYSLLTLESYDYSNLSGAEIKYDKLLNSFSIVNHVQAVDMVLHGRLRGNMHYKEDTWHIQITPINYKLKDGLINKPLILIPSTKALMPEQYVVNTPSNAVELLNNVLANNNFPTYSVNDFKSDWDWHEGRLEMKIRDKYCKIRVVYSGNDLAIISMVLSLFSNSLA